MITVIIPTLNGGDKFVRLMDSLDGQNLRPDEVIVIDSGSTDTTISVAKKFGADIKSIHRQDFDHGGTRSMAAKLAKGETLVFLTQDAVPADEDALQNLLVPMEDPKIAGAYGRQLPWPDATCFARYLRLFNYPEKSEVKCFEDREKYGFKTAFMSNSFAAYRKSLLQEVGYFPDGLLFGEDAYTMAKLLHKGYCAAYVSEARVWHSHNYTFFDEFRRYFDIGVFHVDHKQLLESFGKPMGEGKKYVRFEIGQLVQEAKYIRMPECILRNGMKFMAYKLGKKYSFLPRRLASLCSLNRGWWAKN